MCIRDSFILFASGFGHQFWNLSGDARAAQYANFTKNFSLIGGLVFYWVAGPVSYTHLDVYKRQERHLAFAIAVEGFQHETVAAQRHDDVGLFRRRFAAVSYTHLDVYKRQTNA